MRGAVFKFVVLVTMVVSFICTPTAASCLSVQFKKDSGVCKIADQKVCHHKACPMHTEAQSHRHEGPSAHTYKTFIGCAGAGHSAINHASFDETVFLRSNIEPLSAQDGASFVPEHIAPCLKDTSLPVEIPPKL